MIFVSVFFFFFFFFLQKQAITTLNSTSLKEDVFLDLWHKLNSTENDLRDVKDQVHNLTSPYERGTERERERVNLELGVKLNCLVPRIFNDWTSSPQPY